MALNEEIPWGPSRLVYPSAQPMYAAARRWRDEALIGDRSLFDGRTVDGKAAFVELRAHYLENLGVGTGTFPSKLRAQLANASPDAIQVGAELLYVHALIANTASWSAKAKLTLINTVIGFRDSGTTRVPTELETPLAGGAVNTGQAYGSYRWMMFHYLIRVFGAIKSLSPEARSNALESLDAYRSATVDVDPQTAWAQQFALEHLLFPDVAPPVIGRDDRDALVKTFAKHGADVVDVYANLEPNESYGPHTVTNPYRSPYLHQWKPEPLEEVYAGWAVDVMAAADLEQEERSYKLARVTAIADALRSARDGEDPEPLLRTALRGFNVVDYRVVDTFLTFASVHREETIAALAELQRDPGPESVDRFLAHIPVEALPGIGARLSLASALLLGCDAERLPPWRETAALATRRLSGGGTADSGATAGEVYLYFLERLDAIKQAVDRQISGHEIGDGAAPRPAGHPRLGVDDRQRGVATRRLDAGENRGVQPLAVGQQEGCIRSLQNLSRPLRQLNPPSRKSPSRRCRSKTSLRRSTSTPTALTGCARRWTRCRRSAS